MMKNMIRIIDSKYTKRRNEEEKKENLKMPKKDW